MATHGQVLVVVFGQELPDAASSAALQLFSLIVAAVGFASFALVLALVEQVVLQVLDTNVRQGGPVYEEGHILVLSLADNQRDQEVIWKILSQVCRQIATSTFSAHRTVHASSAAVWASAQLSEPATCSSTMGAAPATELNVPSRRCAWPTATRAGAAS